MIPVKSSVVQFSDLSCFAKHFQKCFYFYFCHFDRFVCLLLICCSFVFMQTLQKTTFCKKRFLAKQKYHRQQKWLESVILGNFNMKPSRSAVSTSMKTVNDVICQEMNQNDNVPWCCPQSKQEFQNESGVKILLKFLPYILSLSYQVES